MTPLRRGVLGVAVLLVACGVVAGLLMSGLARVEAASDRATARARGVVVPAGPGEEDDLRVRWTDVEGTIRTDRIGVYAVDRYPVGAAVALRYDPRAPDDLPFVDDPDETLRTDDFAVPLGAVLAVVTALLLGWAYRGTVFALRRRAEPRREPVELVEGLLVDGAPIPIGTSTPWVRLVGVSGAGGRSLQRVMWHPALTAAPTGIFEADVRGPVNGPRSVVVTLPDGSTLVPVGPRRRRLPWFVEPSAVRADLGSQDVDWVLPPGATRPGRRRRCRGAVVVAVAALAAGGVGWLIIGSQSGVAAFAVGGAGLLVHGRALAGVRT